MIAEVRIELESSKFLVHLTATSKPEDSATPLVGHKALPRAQSSGEDSGSSSADEAWTTGEFEGYQAAKIYFIIYCLSSSIIIIL